MMPLFRKALSDMRRVVLAYGLGLALLAAVYSLLYPSITSLYADLELPAAYSAVIGDIEVFTEPRGYLQAEFFSIWVPLILIIYMVIASTSLVAGAEQSGTLELMLAQPITRRRLLLQRMAALALGVTLVCALAAVGFVAAVPFVDFEGEMTLWQPVTACFGYLPFAWSLGALGFLLGAVMATRTQAAGLMTVAVVAFYVVNVISGLVEGLESMKYLTPFYYADTLRMLSRGPVLWHQTLLIIVAVMFTTAAVLVFERREIQSGSSS